MIGKTGGKLYKDRDNSRQRQFIPLATLPIILLLLLVAPTITKNAAAQEIVLQETAIHISDLITFKVLDGNGYELIIKSETDEYKLIGDLEEEITYNPKETGPHSIILKDPLTGNTISTKNFDVYDISLGNVVLDENNNNVFIETDKENYIIGETVKIKTSAPSQQYKLYITSPAETVSYIGELSDQINYIPKLAGQHTIRLNNDRIEYIKEFSVYENQEQLPNIDESQNNNQNLQQNQNNQAQPEIPSSNEAIDKWMVLEQIKSAPIISQGQTPPESELRTDLQIFPDKVLQRSEPETPEAKEFEKEDENTMLRIDDAYSAGEEISLKFENLAEDFVIGLEEAIDGGQTKLPNQAIISENSISAMQELAGKEIVSGEKLQASDTTYTIELKDSYGNKIDADLKINEKTPAEFIFDIENEKDLRPGLYRITITDDTTEITEQRWFAYGLISVNTHRPIYEPGSTAKLIIVVLNARGIPVSGASSSLLVKSPDGQTTILSTAAGTITETENRGVYEASFSLDDSAAPGKYEITASTTLEGQAISTETYFMVNESYPYDIIRDVPATIDPAKGPFRNEFTIVPRDNASENMTFIEILPAKFIITNTSAHEIRYINNSYALVWHLSPEIFYTTNIWYEAQTPLLSPYLYELGASEIYYTDPLDNISYFPEARSWLLAIDPAAITCTTSPCDTGTSVDGRDTITGGAEPNQPNTIDSCTDGTSGTYHSDESLDRIVITDLNRTTFTEGDTVEVNITVWCWGTADNLNWVYTNNSASPSWRVINSLNCPSGGSLQTFSTTFVLDEVTGDHTIRGVFQYNGNSATTCGAGGYDDNDDVTLTVAERDLTPPTITNTTINSSSIPINQTVKITSYVSDISGVSEVVATVRKPDGTLVNETLSSEFNSASGSTSDIESGSVNFYGRMDRVLTSTYNYNGVTTGSTNASAWFNDVDQFLYGGLTANRNTHVAFTNTQYTNIASSDNTYATSVDPGASDEIVADFMFMITQNISRITNINFTTESRVGIAGTSSRAIYVLQSGAAYQTNSNWLSLGSCSGASNTDLTCTQSLTSGFSTYINSGTGRIDWSAYLDVSSEINYYDYAEMVVSYLDDPDTDAVGSWTTYENVSFTPITNISRINVTVGVTTYSGAGSSTNGNTAPDLQLEMYNGTDWITIGNFSVTTTGNFSLSTTNSGILSSWETEDNRDMRIRGVGLDYASAVLRDNITYTSATVSFEYLQESYSTIWNDTSAAGRYNITTVYTTDNEGNSNQTEYSSLAFLVLNYGAPIITINDVEGDTTEQYSFSSQTPSINATVDTNATCYVSVVDETYAQMVANGRINCGTYEIGIPKSCTYSSSLNATNYTLHMSCNNTLSGTANSQTNNKDLNIDVLCDTHSDCPNEFCDYTFHCRVPIVTGFECKEVTFDAQPADEACGYAPSTARCINDSSYSFTGWYCSFDNNDCVYNNSGNSFDLNYALCDTSSAEYRLCSASQTWSSLNTCAALNQGADPFANSTTNLGGNCSYYASAQTCSSGDTDLGTYGCIGTPTDCGAYTYIGGGVCGSTLPYCDMGCGAACDADTNVSPTINSGICYYDKSCTNACSLSESQEDAPDFCINDEDGGPCAYNNRTDPSSADTCYYSVTCADSVGAEQASTEPLTQDYCDYCTSTGTIPGNYSPAPNASCSSNCDNTGLIWYDSGQTPSDRTDDCNGLGVTTIMNSTLSYGVIWNGSSEAYCDPVECELDAGEYLNGTCTGGFPGTCVFSDPANPEITVYSPLEGEWFNYTPVFFEYYVIDLGSAVENCTLYINDTPVNTTISVIENETLNFTYDATPGAFNWSITCTDSYANVANTGTFNSGYDNSYPSLSNPQINQTLFDINQYVCINLTTTDTYSGVNNVYAQIDLPAPYGFVNVSLVSGVTACNPTGAANVYSKAYQLVFSGVFNWDKAFVKDVSGNMNSLDVNLNWTVTAAGFLSTSLISPLSDVLLNETISNTDFVLECYTLCTDLGTDCEEINIHTQYDAGKGLGEWTSINETGENLTINVSSAYCGNLTANGTIKITIIQNVTVLDTFQSSANPYTLDNAQQMARKLSNGFAYVSSVTDDSFTILNVSDPENIQGLGFFTDSAPPGSIDGAQGIKVDQTRELLFVCAPVDDSFSIYNISNRASPSFVGSIPTSSTPPQTADGCRDIEPIQKGDQYYLAVGAITDDQVTLWNITDPTNPTFLSNYSTGTDVSCSSDNVRTMEWAPDIDALIIASYTDDAITLLDISEDGSSISCIATYRDNAPPQSVDGPAGFEYDPNTGLIYVAGSVDDTMAILDASSGTSIDYVSEYRDVTIMNLVDDCTVSDVTGSQTFAYCVTLQAWTGTTTFQNGSIAIINVTDPQNPTYLESISYDDGSCKMNLTNYVEEHEGILYTISSNDDCFYSIKVYDYYEEEVVTSCNASFVVSSTGDSSGNNTWPVRCIGTGENVPNSFSSDINVTVNDAPTPIISSPANNSWISMSTSISATASYDSDGTIINYLFEYDNNTNFDSATIICNNASNTCSWNTTAQNQCLNNSKSCYVHVTATDDLGLYASSTPLLVGFDTQGPSTSLTRPASFSNISSSTYTLNATVTDAEIGTISWVLFEYRPNNTAPWVSTCNDTDGSSPYSCTWNLTGLVDGEYYEIRAYSNDTFNNMGSASSAANITLDKTGPVVSLISPSNNSPSSGNTTLYFNVTDAISEVLNCALILNGLPNETIINPTQATTLNFTAQNLVEGNNSWSVSCTDYLGNVGQSEQRNIIVDTTGPLITVTRPATSASVYGYYEMNASIFDAGVGSIDQVYFYYRPDSLSPWTYACNDTDGVAPFNCTWDTTTLNGGNTYQVQAIANDTLGNNGSSAINLFIVVDNNGPYIDYLSPPNNFKDTDGNITIRYRVDDNASSVANCSLYINGTLNQTTTGPTEGVASYFYLYNLNDSVFVWSIGCWDTFSPQLHYSTTANRTLVVSIEYILNATLEVNSTEYQKGNEDGDVADLKTNTTDSVGEILDAKVTTDIIRTSGDSQDIWWNSSWDRRTRLTITETGSFDRSDQWVSLPVVLDASCNNIAHGQSLRLVDNYGQTIPFNEWNITLCPNANYVQSLWISFRLNIDADETTNFYIYHSNQSGFTKTANPQGPMSFVWVDSGGSGNAPNTATIKSDLNTALSNLGLSSTGFYAEISTSATSSDLSFSQIQNYSIVFYDSAAKYQNSWDATEAAALTEFVNQSGNLFLTGQDLGYDANQDGWINTLNWRRLTRTNGGWTDNTNPSTFTLSTNHPVTQYIGNSGTTVSVASDYEDGYTTLSGTNTVQIINWTGSSNPVAGTASLGLTDDLCDGFCGNSVFYSGPFYISATQGIQSATAREQFLRGIIDWFLNNNSISVAYGETEEFVLRNSTTLTISGSWSWLLNVYNLPMGSYNAVTQGEKSKYNNATDSKTFNITQDSFAPQIGLITPANNTEANSSVTFAYSVEDSLSTVENCSLYIDGTLEDVSETVQESLPQFFYPRIPSGGPHLWSVCCTDYYGNSGCSVNNTVIIIPPDLSSTTSNFSISPAGPYREFENISLNITIFNIGGSDTPDNFTVQLWDGDPDINGVQITPDYTLSLTDPSGSNSSYVLNWNWTIPRPGTSKLFLIIDPPLSSNGSIFEINESNNKIEYNISTPGYITLYGTFKKTVIIGSSDDFTFVNFSGIVNSTGIIFFTPAGTIDFDGLRALGRNVFDGVSSSDFSEADILLNMTSFEDSVNIVWTGGTNTPYETTGINVSNNEILYAPVVNSSTSGVFKTGILWDSSQDVGDGEYDSGDAEPLIFFSEIVTGGVGDYGTYDFQAQVPALLRSYSGIVDDKIYVYYEIQ